MACGDSLPTMHWHALDTFCRIPDSASRRFFRWFLGSSPNRHFSSTEYGILGLKLPAVKEMIWHGAIIKANRRERTKWCQIRNEWQLAMFLIIERRGAALMLDWWGARDIETESSHHTAGFDMTNTNKYKYWLVRLEKVQKESRVYPSYPLMIGT